MCFSRSTSSTFVSQNTSRISSIRTSDSEACLWAWPFTVSSRDSRKPNSGIHSAESLGFWTSEEVISFEHMFRCSLPGSAWNRSRCMFVAPVSKYTGCMRLMHWAYQPVWHRACFFIGKPLFPSEKKQCEHTVVDLTKLWGSLKFADEKRFSLGTL